MCLGLCADDDDDDDSFIFILISRLSGPPCGCHFRDQQRLTFSSSPSPAELKPHLARPRCLSSASSPASLRPSA